MADKAIEARVAALVDAGAVMTVWPGGLPLHIPVGYAVWDGPALLWCSLWPQDQHHAHRQDRGGPSIVHERDVVWYHRGDVVACLCPAAEAADLPPTYAEDWARWRAELEAKGARKALEDFLRDSFA